MQRSKKHVQNVNGGIPNLYDMLWKRKSPTMDVPGCPGAPGAPWPLFADKLNESQLPRGLAILFTV